MKLYESYRERAQKASGVSFLGRLATYRYMDMHQVIGEAMDFSTKVLEAEEGGQDWPLFSGE